MSPARIKYRNNLEETGRQNQFRMHHECNYVKYYGINKHNIIITVKPHDKYPLTLINYNMYMDEVFIIIQNNNISKLRYIAQTKNICMIHQFLDINELILRLPKEVFLVMHSLNSH